MNKNMISYAAIVAVVVSIPGFLGLRSTAVSISVCLAEIVLMIFLYQRITKENEDPTKNTVGQGAMFGLFAGLIVFVLFFVQVFTILGADGLREIMLQEIQKNADMTGGTTGAQIDAIDAMSDNTIIALSSLGALFNLIAMTVIGLIAGLIFKHREDED